MRVNRAMRETCRRGLKFHLSLAPDPALDVGLGRRDARGQDEAVGLDVVPEVGEEEVVV